MAETTTTSSTPSEAQLRLTIIRDREKEDLANGQRSYFDILYAEYTPCGAHYYSHVRDKIPSRDHKKTSKKFSRDSIEYRPLQKDSPLVKEFVACVQKYSALYSLRQQHLDAFQQEEIKKFYY